MKRIPLNRFLAMVLVFAMLAPMFGGLTPMVTAASTEKTVYVLAGSDFQDNTDELSKQNVEAILENIKKAQFTSFDGFMFCGDYSNQSAWTKENSGAGLAKLKETVEKQFGTIENQYYVQGNHDPWDTVGLSQSIGYETEYYSVFVLNEDDYCWHGEANEEKLKNKVADMKDFLDKQVVGEKPVFILSHVPLHYSWRTDYIQDAQYAKYIVDALNEAGQRGLNVFFLYGHNHGGGLDNYLGGSTNFIPKGDTLYIADPLNNEIPSVPRTINFTYMNAGMVGYYGDTDYDKDGYHVDGALTMSVFAITGDDVEVRRFCGGTTVDSVTNQPYCTCSNGRHMVKKSVGDWYDENEEKYFGYQLNTKTFASPQKVAGSDVELTAPVHLANNEFSVGSSAVVAAPSQQGYQYTWESSNPDVVTVSAMNTCTALLTGQSVGSAKITVTKSAITRSTAAGESTSFYVQVTEGEGVVVEDSGQKIFRRTQTFKHGKRYIITNWPRESWDRNDICTLMAPDSGYGPTNYMATAYMYPDGVPYLTQASVPSNNANVWRFETSGTGVDDEGYLISERTGEGYSGIAWYLGLGSDMRTIWVTTNPNPGSEMGYANSGVYLASAEWSWGSCLLNTKVSGGETYWLGFHNGARNWQSITGTEWSGASHTETYIFEETNNVATAIVSDKVGYVAVNGTELPTKLIKTWSTGKVEYISVTLDMLSDELGNPVSTGTAGTYSNLTVTYNGVAVCTDYTLAVGTQVTGEVSDGGCYYRLTNTMVAGKEYVFVHRNTEGKAYVLVSQGYDVDTSVIEVPIQMDANGIPCIREINNLTPAAVWKHCDNGVERWLERSDYPGNYLCFNPAEGAFFTKDAVLHSGHWNNNVGTVMNKSMYYPYIYTSRNTPGLEGWTTVSAQWGNIPAYLTYDKHMGRFVSVGARDADYRMWGEEIYVYEKIDITTATYEALGTTGKVNAGVDATSRVGTSVEIRYPDGTVVVEYVTADMLYLNGEALTSAKLTTPVRMTGLTLKYNGQVLTNNFTLDVLSELENDYPEFPAPGSVRVDKHLGNPAFDFSQTGVSEVHLAVTGTPKTNPMDILVIIDTSSSVVDNYMENGETRLEVMRQALGDLIDTLQAPNPDGTLPDVCLAVSQFNDYTYFGSDNTLKGYEPFGDRGIDGKYNGKISDFQNIYTMDNFDMSLIQGHGGTNYDVAFQTAYEMLSERKQQYAEIGEREQIVVFMTDGICFQYNYLTYRHGADTCKPWEKWMIGGLSTDELEYYVTSEYLRELYKVNGSSGKHWMAEAIKGGADDDTTTSQSLYTVIWNENRDTGAVFNENVNIRNVSGLGASIYSIGFGIDVDGEYNSKIGKQVLSNFATDPSMYYDANDKQDLRDAFSDIGRSVRKAATNAYMKDQMGKYFDLQMGQVTDSSKNVFAAPSIKIQSFDLYRMSEVGKYVNGVLVTMDMVGTRKSTIPTATLETISFSADGKTVTSSVLSDANILKDGVICGKYFYYNTSKTTAKDIVVNGKTVNLGPETIYWYIGDILEREVELVYSVYLENSMGEDNVGCEAGTYDTNNYADLHYINFNGNPCKQETQTPKLPWKTATVGYAFYLVDENGNVITNQATGEIGGFANRIPVTTVVTNELKLNVDSGEYSAIKAEDVLPEGYTLFDENASYKVHVYSGDSTGGYWTIDATSGLKPTTYVTGYNGSDFTTDLKSSNSNYDYGHTTVWFAVKYTVQAMPDVVVIDYGLPVNIHILANDLFPTGAKADGIFFDKVNYTFKSVSEANQPVVGSEAQGNFGSLKLDAEGGTVCYTLNNKNGMQMNQEEVFTYRVPYSYTTMVNGQQTTEQRYYYATVTVIPAANIYYEDDFFQFTDSKNPNGANGAWSAVVNNSDNAQAEDRPGTDNMAGIDADNVYGYDGVNNPFQTYSLNNYHLVTVDQTSGSFASAPSVKFTFTGTGFDLISVTNSDSGTIMVEVVNDKGERKRSLVVDNYYGYTYENGAWIVQPDTSDCLYQVPVIKVEGLDYGTYTVTVKVGYMGMFDHDNNDSYSFWMDSVRIYNPAGLNLGNENTIGNAYKKDQESNPTFVTIRDVLVAADSFYADGGATGAVFIDGKLNDGATVADYANQGPNNEVYLAGGQTIAFKLVTNTNPANIQTVQIGAKLAKGSSAQLYYGTKELVTLKTATNMFYKLENVSWNETVAGKEWTSNTIVLTNKATNGTVDQIISLTDVKVTSNVVLKIISGTTAIESALLDEADGAAIVLRADGLTVKRAAAVMNAIENTSNDTSTENPGQSPEDKPTENPEDKPTENPEDKPTENPEDKPTEDPEDKPTEDPEDKPDQKPENPGNDDDSDTSTPVTGDSAERLIPAFMILAALCVALLLTLRKLDANAKKEACR